MWSVCCAVLLSCALAASEEFAAAAGAAGTELARVREGCERIGETLFCITGNVTGTILHVQCTAENYPLGEDVTIYLHYHPYIYEPDEYKLPLRSGCSFKEWEISKYTCSFKTDISEFTPGTTFQCVFNRKYQQRPFLTKTDQSYKPSKYRSEARRPEPLLNCQYRMGFPAITWSLSDTSGVAQFTPNTQLSAFCVLACHEHSTQLDDWELVWTLSDRILNYATISDRRVENLTLDYNLTREDEGKQLECSLRNRLANGSLQILRKLSATLATKVDSSNDYSIYSDWLLMGVIAALLLFIYALIGVSDRQHDEQENLTQRCQPQ